MAFEKVVEARIFGVTNQASDVRMPTGDSSGNTFTGIVNPLRASRFWDRGMYVLTGVSIAAASTFVVTIHTDAIAGYTGLPIARATLNPSSATRVIMDNLHKSAATPIPTHIFIDQTAGTGGAWFQCTVIAKQYRGVLSTSGGRSAERVLEGVMQRQRSLTVDTIDTISATGQTASFMGLDKMRLWDNAMFWAVVGQTITGTWDCHVQALCYGVSFDVASTGTAATGAMSTAGDKIALASNFYGQCPRPSHIFWDEKGAGSLTGVDLVMIAKSGRGSNVGRG